MYTTEPIDCAFPDIDLLTRHTEVEEDGILTGPNATGAITFCERKGFYKKVRAAVHEQYKPANVYQHILADRMADCIWRAERYASFETTALNFQIQRQWDHTNELVPKASVGVHAYQAFQTMDPAQRKSLMEALKLEERYWRRHRVLAAELRLVQRLYPN
ncbi:hypothetical protein [Paludibaculum fermentans]|uniref:Uncharacterized protein n=1 Tax=Paludibaculum fermentans TaxID=1473598 RepID=A0A7S7NLJ5_PALFE|nr:hypothetical protein [Paludibaculum fermentans]QOY85876.1 hypothetical protein IRI77_24055 [Paludibaculum fermentans]